MKIALIKYLVKNVLETFKYKLSKRKNKIAENSELTYLFDLPPDILNNTLIISFCNSNIPKSVPYYQKEVFQLFAIPLVQVIGNITHAEFMEKILKECEQKYLIFFDIDAIPLKKECIYIYYYRNW